MPCSARHPSIATVVGQTPSANVPAVGVDSEHGSRDVVGGAVSEFTITEAGNTLPPTDGTAASNPMPANTFNPYTHTAAGFGSGAWCAW